MGSSVFHGGFSTFVAISVLAPSDTYIFVAFYRLWFGIILFGMANGFFLIPVVLSYVGPLETSVDPHLHIDEAEVDIDHEFCSDSSYECSYETPDGSVSSIVESSPARDSD